MASIKLVVSNRAALAAKYGAAGAATASASPSC